MGQLQFGKLAYGARQLAGGGQQHAAGANVQQQQQQQLAVQRIPKKHQWRVLTLRMWQMAHQVAGMVHPAHQGRAAAQVVGAWRRMLTPAHLAVWHPSPLCEISAASCGLTL